MNQMTPPLLISLSLWWTYLCFCALHLSRGPSKKCHWCRGINSSVVPQWLQFSKAFKVMAFWDLADECLFTELTPFIFDRHFFVSLLSVSLSGEEILSFKSLLLSYCGCPSVSGPFTAGLPLSGATAIRTKVIPAQNGQLKPDFPERNYRK